MTSAMHFGPEWMRDKRSTKPRSHVSETSPSTFTHNTGSSSYSSVATPPQVPQAPLPHDLTHPFRYSKAEILQVWKDGGGRGGLALEVERWGGVVREIAGEPIGLKDMSDSDRKAFASSVNSEIRRRVSHDPVQNGISGLRSKLNHMVSPTDSGLRDRPTTLSTRKKKEDSGNAEILASPALSETSPRVERISTTTLPEQHQSQARNETAFPLTSLDDDNPWSAKRTPTDAFLRRSSKLTESFREEQKNPQIRSQVEDAESKMPSLQANSGLEHCFTELNIQGVTTSLVEGVHIHPEQEVLIRDDPPPGLGYDPFTVMWSYIDPTGQIQGPFPALTMQKWHEQGYFNLELLMRRVDIDVDWNTLGYLLTFASGPHFFTSHIPFTLPHSRFGTSGPFDNAHSLQDSISLTAQSSYPDGATRFARTSVDHLSTLSPLTNSPSSTFSHKPDIRSSASPESGSVSQFGLPALEPRTDRIIDDNVQSSVSPRLALGQPVNIGVVNPSESSWQSLIPSEQIISPASAFDFRADESRGGFKDTVPSLYVGFSGPIVPESKYIAGNANFELPIQHLVDPSMLESGNVGGGELSVPRLNDGARSQETGEMHTDHAAHDKVTRPVWIESQLNSTGVFDIAQHHRPRSKQESISPQEGFLIIPTQNSGSVLGTNQVNGDEKLSTPTSDVPDQNNKVTHEGGNQDPKNRRANKHKSDVQVVEDFKSSASTATGSSHADETEVHIFNTHPKPAWANPDEYHKSNKNYGPGLREIQEADRKEKQARKTRERALRSTISGLNESDEIVTTSWGLPTSQVGGTRIREKDTKVASINNHTPVPVWTNVVSGAKSMKEIQDEEEKHKKFTREKENVAGTVKRVYAESASKESNPLPSNGAWTTVGAQSKSNANKIPVMAPPHPEKSKLATGTTSTKPLGASKIVGANKPDDGQIAPSIEFLKWLKDALKGLNPGVNVEEFMQILLSFPVEASPETVELIQEQAYANSTTIDGRRFASEFLSRRKADLAPRAHRKQAVVGVASLAEVVKTVQKPAQPEWGYKVVRKKGKGGRGA